MHIRIVEGNQTLNESNPSPPTVINEQYEEEVGSFSAGTTFVDAAFFLQSNILQNYSPGNYIPVAPLTPVSPTSPSVNVDDNGPSTYSNGFNQWLGENVRWAIGDDALAGASDVQLFLATTAASAGIVFGAYYAATALGLVGTGGAIGSTLSALNALSAGYSGANFAINGDFENGLNFVADTGSVVLDLVGSKVTGVTRLALYGADVLVNLTQGAYYSGKAIDDFQNENYLQGTFNALAGIFSFGSAGLRIAKLRRIKRIGRLANGVTEISISKLNPAHSVPRMGKPKYFIENLAEKIRANGYDVTKPAHAIRLPNGDLMISGGHHRIAAMAKLGESTIPVRITNAIDDPVRTARILGIGRLTGKYKGSYFPELTSQQQAIIDSYLEAWKKVNL